MGIQGWSASKGGYRPAQLLSVSMSRTLTQCPNPWRRISWVWGRGPGIVPNARTRACPSDPGSLFMCRNGQNGFSPWASVGVISSARGHGVGLLSGDELFLDCRKGKFPNPCMRGTFGLPHTSLLCGCGVCTVCLHMCSRFFSVGDPACGTQQLGSSFTLQWGGGAEAADT